MIRLKSIIIALLILCLIAGVFVAIILNKDSEAKFVASSLVSNEKIQWGLKRGENGAQPDITLYRQTLDLYNGMSMGNAEDKIIYLTFDQGYEAGYTSQILDVLEKTNVKATFFITGHYLNSQTDLVKRMVDEGHIIGNHTSNHYDMVESSDELVRKEILDLHTAVLDKVGYEMCFFRPPKGEFSARTLELTNNLGYTTVMWSSAYDDFDEKNLKGEEYGKNKILNNVHPGSIILLHGNSKDNANILEECINTIKEMGYEFKNLDEFKK